jgi:RimJ/RimL family protein N-acetyltransferase
LEEADVPIVARWLRDPDTVRAYLGVADAITEEQVSDVLEWSREDDTVAAWALDDLDGNLVGSSNWRQDEPWVGVYESEIVLDPALPRRAGWGIEAHKLMLDNLFTRQPSARKVVGRAVSFNEGAIAVMRRLGLVEEGRLRRQVALDGVDHDLLIFGMLREEWEPEHP